MPVGSSIPTPPAPLGQDARIEALGLPAPVRRALQTRLQAADTAAGVEVLPAGWRWVPDAAGGWRLLETSPGSARPWAAGDRFGALHLAACWTGHALGEAWFLLPGDGWLELRPRTGHDPLWGTSDSLWHHPADEAGAAVEAQPVGLLPAQDYTAVRHLPPLDRPEGLPPGAGSTMLNFLALLLALQGAPRITYRGPYPTPALFATLRRSFEPELPLAEAQARFTRDETTLAFGGRMAEVPVGWRPEPFTASRPRAGLLLHWREGLETAWIGTVPFRRGAIAGASGQPGVLPAGERVWAEAEPGSAQPSWAVGLVLLGRPYARFLRIGPDGAVRQAAALAAAADDDEASANAPLHPLWREVAFAWSALRAHPALAQALASLEPGVPLRWEALPLQLAATSEGCVRVQVALAAAFRERCSNEDAAALAAMLVSDVLEALQPHLRRLARQRLEAEPLAEPTALLAAGKTAQAAARTRLERALPALLAALVQGEALPAEEGAAQVPSS